MFLTVTTFSLISMYICFLFQCDIEGYFDKRERIIYLHLKGSYDANILVKILDEYCVQIEEKVMYSYSL